MMRLRANVGSLHADFTLPFKAVAHTYYSKIRRPTLRHLCEFCIEMAWKFNTLLINLLIFDFFTLVVLTLNTYVTSAVKLNNVDFYPQFHFATLFY